MPHLPHRGDYRWEGLEILRYKEEGHHFRDITRQLLYSGRKELDVQARYFEIAPGGHSTLERHEHVHLVLVLRGTGEALVDGEVRVLGRLDLVEIPPKSWHQFRANRGEILGFLCLVRVERDRPERPGPEHLSELGRNPAVASFIRP